jgi:Histidine kinase-, DNA gyrase B-, and HSP90-like ATPase
MSNQPANPDTPRADGFVSGEPTKTFFILMLVRDITVDDAIIDLIDNSVDAAHAYYKDRVAEAQISLSVSADQFVIDDNCGGMLLKTAKEVAFKIGREEINFQDDDQSIGQFGVV